MNKRIEKSSWRRIKRFINSKEIGYVFTRKEFLSELKEVIPGTLDTYRGYLEGFRVLERAGRGKYKLIQKIPEKMNTASFTYLMSQDKWKRWFIPLQEQIDRMEHRYK
jgi:hypothetical protein